MNRTTRNKPRPFEADIASRISVPDTTSWTIATRGSLSAKLSNGHSVLIAQMRWPSQLPLRKLGHEGDCALGCAVGPYALAIAADVIIAPHCLELGVQPEQRIKLRCPVIAAFGAVRDVSRGLKLCSAARYHSWCARYSDRSVVTECAFDTYAQCLATRRRRRLVPEIFRALCPTDFFAKYRRSGGACPFLVGILAARFRCLIIKKRYVR